MDDSDEEYEDDNLFDDEEDEDSKPRYVDLGGQPIEVMPELCGTCVFRSDEDAIELSPGRKDQIQLYLINGTTHLCHHAAVHGKDDGRPKACRGGRDYQLTIWYRMGMIREPTDEALAEVMNSLGISAPEVNIPGRVSKIT